MNAPIYEPRYYTLETIEHDNPRVRVRITRTVDAGGLTFWVEVIRGDGRRAVRQRGRLMSRQLLDELEADLHAEVSHAIDAAREHWGNIEVPTDGRS